MPEIKHSTEAIFYYWIFGLTKAFSNGHIWETKEETEEEILKILIQLNSKKSWMASLADFSGVHKTRNLFGNGSSLPMNLILSIGFPVRMRYGSIQSLKGRNRGIFHHLPKWSTDEKNSLFLWVFSVNCHWLYGQSQLVLWSFFTVFPHFSPTDGWRRRASNASCTTASPSLSLSFTPSKCSKCTMCLREKFPKQENY